jgi:hypothetical protein
MEIVQLVLAAGCLLLGIFPATIVRVILSTLVPSPAGLAGLGQASRGAFAALPWQGLTLNFSGMTTAVVNPIFLLMAFIGCTLIVFLMYRSVRVNSRPASIWNCGEVVSDEMVRYRASSYYKPFRNLIHPIYKKIRFPRLSPPQLYARGLDFDRWIYFPIGSVFTRIGRVFSKLHNGVPQFYLLWQVIGLVLSITFVLWLMGGK